ncbi:efflux RND transporter permease subunit [Piscirickettsia litoralis]|uniref:efflux RND transporter permease subunit n=1 Tax=Piscirickettsia litoralis TaxID=1891921 RepID=UPI002285956F|nr:efflux RND transporter permease subunit [Piscirickettsia litoralis]
MKANEQGGRITLGEIAQVALQSQEQEVLLFYQGKPAVELYVQRNEQGNALQAAKILEKWRSDLQPKLGESIKLTIYDEQWKMIDQRLSLLINNGVAGLAFILIILFIFLNRRVAFWIAFGIPISFMATLGVLYLIGGSIDMVTMFALIMSLGIIVDDTIVVGEDTLVHYQQGRNPVEAAVAGAIRMSKPVLASSLTTIAAFLPLMLIGGLIGQILQIIPTVVICVIIASLLECFLVLPAHLKVSLGNMHKDKAVPWRQRFDWRYQKFIDGPLSHFVDFSLKNRQLIIVIGVAAFAISIALLASGRVPFTFFPTPDGNVLKLNVGFVAGTPQKKVKQLLRYSEQQLEQINHDYQARNNQGFLVLTNLVLGKTADTQGDESEKRGDVYGHLNVELTPADNRKVSNRQLIAIWKNHIQLPPQVESFEITVVKGGPPGRDIDIRLSGATPIELKNAALKVQSELAKFAGVMNITDDLPFGQEQWLFELKPAAKTVGLTINDIARQVQHAYSGYQVQLLSQGRDEIEVNIRLPNAERYNLASLKYLPIKTKSSIGTMLPLEDLVTIKSVAGFEELRHSAGEISVHVTAEVNAELANANKVLAELKVGVLKKIASQDNIQVSFAGRSQEQKETLNDMLFGAGLALIFIYLILVVMFSSYSWPLFVMSIIPLSLSGAIFGHWLLGYDMTILSLFGLFGLAGIVTNDSIILVSFYKNMKGQAHSLSDALASAIKQRFRAVFLTSITTIAGLLPLLFETSLQAKFLIPMAVSITFGLAWSLFLILFLLPALLLSYEESSWRHKIKRKLKHYSLF